MRLVRDLDMDRAFEAAVSEALSASPLPSAFVIAGDIFDTYRGSSDAFLTAVEQIRRLREAGIAVIGIAGNHDTPTNLLRTPMFKMLLGVFQDDPGVALAYDDIQHVRAGDIEYVLLPHTPCLAGGFSERDLLPASDAPYAVLVVHGVAAGDPSLSQMDEIKEVPISAWVLDLGWDYVAFGHYHKPGWIPGREGRAAYSGSLENTVVSGPDVCMRRGPVFVDLAKPAAYRYDMHPLPIRSIIELDDIDVEGEEITAEELDERICSLLLAQDLAGAIVRHKVKGVTRALYKSLSRRAFGSVVPDALLIKTEFEYAKERERPGLATVIAAEAAAAEGGEVADDGDLSDVARNAGVEGTGAESGGFQTLPGEIDLAIADLVAMGEISSHKAEIVKETLHGLLEEH